MIEGLAKDLLLLLGKNVYGSLSTPPGRRSWPARGSCGRRWRRSSGEISQPCSELKRGYEADGAIVGPPVRSSGGRTTRSRRSPSTRNNPSPERISSIVRASSSLRPFKEVRALAQGGPDAAPVLGVRRLLRVRAVWSGRFYRRQVSE